MVGNITARTLFIVCLASQGLFLSFSTSQATLLLFFGEDLGLGENARLLSFPNADAARDSFFSNLTAGVLTEDFEGQTPTNPPTLDPIVLNLSFGPDTALLTSDNGLVGNDPTSTGTNNPVNSIPSGVYPTSGDQYFLSFGGFNIVFSSPQAAFGFYAVDAGDNGGQMTLEFVLEGGGSFTETVPHTVSGPGGSVLFYGIIDTSMLFTQINFLGSSIIDGFVFDDMTIASAGQVQVPEPSTLALFATGLAGLGFMGWRRRKRVQLKAA